MNDEGQSQLGQGDELILESRLIRLDLRRLHRQTMAALPKVFELLPGFVVTRFEAFDFCVQFRFIDGDLPTARGMLTFNFGSSVPTESTFLCTSAIQRSSSPETRGVSKHVSSASSTPRNSDSWGGFTAILHWNDATGAWSRIANNERTA